MNEITQAALEQHRAESKENQVLNTRKELAEVVSLLQQCKRIREEISKRTLKMGLELTPELETELTDSVDNDNILAKSCQTTYYR